MHGVLRLLVFVLLVAAAAYGYESLDLGRHMSVDGMRAVVEAHGTYGPLIYMAVCIAGIFMHMPEIVLIAVGGVVFGAAKGFAYGWVACVIGTTSTFLLVRYFARDRFQRILQGRFARLRALDERLERNGLWTVLALRIVFFCAPPLNWLLGATRVRLRHYVVGTALGLIPGLTTAVVLAEAVVNGDAGGELLSPLLAGAVLLVGAAVLVGRRLFGREQGQVPPAAAVQPPGRGLRSRPPPR